MAVRPTSAIAKKEITEDGTVSRQAAEVLRWLKFSPSTIAEIAHALRIYPGTVSGRLFDLREAGLVVSADKCIKRICTQSPKDHPRRAIEWRPASDDPQGSLF